MNALKILCDNPYRVLGAYSNATTKEIVANQGKIKAFQKVGKELSYPLDLNQLLPTVNRSPEDIAQAESCLTLVNDKLKYALFWFIKLTPLDEMAFNHLFVGNVDSAIGIWEKKESLSSLLNLSISSLINGNYKQATAFMIKIFQSDNYREELIRMIGGETFQVEYWELLSIYLDTLVENVDVTTLLNVINDKECNSYLCKKAVTPIIDKIQAEISKASSTEHKNASLRYNVGNTLIQQTKPLLAQLQKILPVTELQHQMIVDNLGLEILQCGIDYYNNSDEPDAATKAMTLQEYANSIVIGKLAKDRCKENVDVLRKIIAELPPKEVYEEHKAIRRELEKFSKLPDKIEYAIDLIKKCAPYLISIKEKLGKHHRSYLNISTQIVGNALHNVIEEVNSVNNENTDLLLEIDRAGTIAKMKVVLQKAWEAILYIDQLHMEDDFRNNKYDSNKKTLGSIIKRKGFSLKVFTRGVNVDIGILEEEELYEYCKKNSNYDIYIKKYPQGKFNSSIIIESIIIDSIKSSRFSLEKIEKEREEDRKQLMESRDFKACRKQEDYENFLKKYPNSMYTNSAHKMIQELKKRDSGCLLTAVVVIILTILLYVFK